MSLEGSLCWGLSHSWLLRSGPPFRMPYSHQTLSSRRCAFHQDQSAEFTSDGLIIHDNKLCNSPTADFSPGCITGLIIIEWRRQRCQLCCASAAAFLIPHQLTVIFLPLIDFTYAVSRPVAAASVGCMFKGCWNLLLSVQCWFYSALIEQIKSLHHRRPKLFPANFGWLLHPTLHRSLLSYVHLLSYAATFTTWTLLVRSQSSTRVDLIKPFKIQHSFPLMFVEKDSLDLFVGENTCARISCFYCSFWSANLSRLSFLKDVALLSVCVSLTLMSLENRHQSCQKMPQTSKYLHTGGAIP